MLIIAAVAAMSLTGCSTLDKVAKHQDSARLVAEGAAVVYLDQVKDLQARAAKAARIRAVIAELEGMVSADETVTLQRLAQLALSRIPTGLEPGEKLLAIELVNFLQTYLGEHVGAGGLTSDSLVAVKTILQAVDGVAALYTSSS